MTGATSSVGALAAMAVRIGAATNVEEVIDAALIGLDELLGMPHSMVLVQDVETGRLVTVGARGYDQAGVGSEVRLGEGVIGMAAERRQPIRIGNLQRMLAYARTVQQGRADEVPGTEIRLPGLRDAQSQLAAPMIARGTLVGVVSVESTTAVAFDDDDEHAVAVVGHFVGAALEQEHLAGYELDPTGPASSSVEAPRSTAGDALVPETMPSALLRHYAADGSTFIDDAYIIKGVAGRLLWKVASEHVATGRSTFTNREARLDPALELPAFRDNFESRLLLLKRRLEERTAPLRIVGTGRGRFDLHVDVPLKLERIADPSVVPG